MASGKNIFLLGEKLFYLIENSSAETQFSRLLQAYEAINCLPTFNIIKNNRCIVSSYISHTLRRFIMVQRLPNMQGDGLLEEI